MLTKNTFQMKMYMYRSESKPELFQEDELMLFLVCKTVNTFNDFTSFTSQTSACSGPISSIFSLDLPFRCFTHLSLLCSFAPKMMKTTDQRIAGS